jgi:hypothetical protein
MPLMLQFVRDGEPMPMPFGFGGWHLQRGYDVAAIEEARRLGEAIDLEAAHLYDEAGRAEFDHQTELAKAAFDRGEVVVTEPIAFCDPADGELLALLPGDVVRMWRS